VVIATRHHLHAAQVEAAMNAGKAVFCEKPLCLSEEELARIVRTLAGRRTARRSWLAFNRPIRAHGDSA